MKKFLLITLLLVSVPAWLAAADAPNKVIAISGAMLVPYFVQLNDLGVRHFLPKPFFLDGLLDSIRVAMN